MMRNNKGFSLVELIIVIAIMAILAGAIAPALIRYIDKSRKSNDISAAKTIKTAVETALSYEKSFELLTTGDGSSTTDTDGNTVNYVGYIEIVPDTPDNGYGNNGITLKPANNAETDADTLQNTSEEIANNLGERTPRIKYRKKANDSVSPNMWYVFCTTQGSISVGLGESTDNGKFYMLAPEISKFYN
ncbi:MAG: type II secretion system protein [Lachnospiraceae bacterium]|nr:type II secretion system protein [Lachnospiraceae bacterium]